jgi:3-phenylpropionate/trans-cinnamate dioxygenase ferredoxin subunit
VARHVVARADEVCEGARRIVDAQGRSIGIFNIGGRFYALRNVCPHQGGPLCAGVVWGSLESSAPGTYDFAAGRGFVRCPWHGWEFDMETGKSWFDPQRTRVARYDVSVANGADLEQSAERVEGPYVVETYPIAADGEYLVLEFP